MVDITDIGLRTILENLQTPSENPVTRARHIVELQVPVSSRGPGWDRHWRELEAYAGTPGGWSMESDPQ